MAGIEYKATKNNVEFKPRTKLDLSIGYTPTTPILGVQQSYRPQVQIKQETPTQESPAEPVSAPEPEVPAMIVSTPERVQVAHTPTTSQNNSQKIDVGNMQHILDKFTEAGINVRVTSGKRQAGQAGKAGDKSHHVYGNAIDIVPGEGETFESIKEKIKNNPSLLKYFRDNKIGIIDETTKDVMKRTGATGAHWHIGPDRLALSGFETMFAKQGGSMPSRIDMLITKFNKQFNK